MNDNYRSRSTRRPQPGRSGTGRTQPGRASGSRPQPKPPGPGRPQRRPNGARRSAPQRRTKKPGRGGCVTTIVAAFLIALTAYLVCVNYVFVIRTVSVTGSGQVPEMDIIRLSGLKYGSHMGRLDEAKVRQYIESDGRFALVSVTEKRPSTVLIEVRERTKDALMLQVGKVLVLDSDGYVVSIGDKLPDPMVPHITGLRPSEFQLGRQLDVPAGQLNAMKAVLEALKQNGASGYVKEINVENTADLRITTRTGIEVLLGDMQDMHNKILYMIGALDDLESRNETIGRMDVAGGGPADFLSYVTPTPMPTPEPTPDPLEPTPDPNATPDPYAEIVLG